MIRIAIAMLKVLKAFANIWWKMKVISIEESFENGPAFTFCNNILIEFR